MGEQPRRRKGSASFYQNTDCAHFPCHKGVSEDEFNCLFCYCPLYALGPRCGGRPAYTERGIKDCTRCTIMHRGENGVALVRDKFGELANLAREDATPPHDRETRSS
jgi:Zn-finger protein